jgi:hypothetical protein
MNDTQALVLGEYGPWGLLKCRAPLAALDTHMYVVGKTKKGKSKFLEQLAYQLIALGQGCGLLDPHGDLADDLLTQLAPHLASLPDQEALRKRIIYLDPSRRDYALPFNTLRTPWDPYRVAQNVLEAFRRAWPESLREAPRFANIVLAATIVLIENKLTLTEMPRLLTDYTYRDMLLRQVSNAEVTRFFRTRYDRWGREQALIVESALNKVGALVINPQLRLILGQRENALPFRRIMDEGKVLICDLGRTDGETRRLLGSLIVTGFEQAALSRQDTPPRARRRFYLLLDEFQEYSAQEGSERTLAQILCECRKFGLHLILAHQHQGQVNAGLQGALENAQLKVIFGVGRGTAQALAGELFRPELTAGEEKSPALAEQWERFIQEAQRLNQREVLVQLPEQEGLRRLRTCRVPEAGLGLKELDSLKKILAKQSGKSVAGIKRSLNGRSRVRGEKGDGIADYEVVTEETL